MIQDTEIEVHYGIILTTTKKSQYRYRYTSRDRFRYVKSSTPPHYIRSRFDNYQRELRSYRSP